MQGRPMENIGVRWHGKQIQWGFAWYGATHRYIRMFYIKLNWNETEQWMLLQYNSKVIHFKLCSLHETRKKRASKRERERRKANLSQNDQTQNRLLDVNVYILDSTDVYSMVSEWVSEWGDRLPIVITFDSPSLSLSPRTERSQTFVWNTNTKWD